MATEQTIDKIRDTFLVGFSGILKISDFFRTPWKYHVTRYSIILAVIVPIVSLLSGLNILALIIEIKTQILAFLPTILGFTIAGYSLVVGFVQSNMLQKISEPAKDSKFSLYQTMSSKFAMNVILQGLALITAYIYHFIIYFDDHNKIRIAVPKCLISSINITALAFITFCLVISLLLIVQIVINIFNFSQLHHYFINMEKVRSTESQNNQSDE